MSIGDLQGILSPRAVMRGTVLSIAAGMARVSINTGIVEFQSVPGLRAGEVVIVEGGRIRRIGDYSGLPVLLL